MFVRDTGAEERPDLYVVPKSESHAGSEVVQTRSKFSYVARLAAALKAKAIAIVAMAVMIAGFVMPQFASHASVAITIDTDVLFGSVNDWIATFLPIFAIGLGIAIALAIISIVGDSILMGLRKGAVR